jgi:NitT/TauT family transport system permease protein
MSNRESDNDERSRNSARSRMADSLRTALSELRNRYFWYGVSSLVLMFGAWEIGSRSEQWFGFSTPSLGALPPPDLILSTLFHMIGTLDFWQNVWLSCVRVFVGFTAAVVLGVPFGLLLALNRFFHGVFFSPPV